MPLSFKQNKLTLIVNLLPSADYIIALGGRGEIVEQGTFQALNTSQGYVRSFSLQQSKPESATTEPTGKFTLGPMSTSPLPDATDNKKRQLGDLSIYLYYFRSIGTASTMLFFFFNAAQGFFSTFPSE
jgi:ATP-binding cassette subfamily C (CFTR/MRP) protein 1